MMVSIRTCEALMLSNEPPRDPRRDSPGEPISLPPGNDLRERILSLKPKNHTEEQLEVLIERIMKVARATNGPLRIGMYDGSFDPPHYGHIETARAAIPIGRLDLMVINCHPKPNTFKPYLAPHDVRTKMLSSYFPGDPVTLVSPLSRREIENVFAAHRIVGVIGSDTFRRFLDEGIATDFNTDEIVVSERQSAPLMSAPARLEGRPVWYVGRTKLAYNTDCSTSIRSSLRQGGDNPTHPMLNSETIRLARAHRLYEQPRSVAPQASAPYTPKRDTPRYTVPEIYKECTIELQDGLENGLLSESYVFQVRDPSGDVIAFMKMLPSERQPLDHLRDEANGLALFNRLGLRTASAPEAIFCPQDPSLWIARAPGVTPGTIITNYDKGMATSQDVYEALFAAGAFLRELHDRHSQPFDHKGAALLETYVGHHQTFIDRASAQELRPLKIQRAIEIFHQEARHLRVQGLRCSLIHGDASPSNCLWDRETKRLSVIDMQRLGTQARTGAGGFSTNEYRAFLSCLTLFPNIGFPGVRGGLDDACAAFKAGYGPVDPHEYRFFRALRFIRKELGGPERVHEIGRSSIGTSKC